MDRKFIAQILETSASGMSGLAASLLLEREPELEQVYGNDTFSNWKIEFQDWLLALSAALDAGESSLFTSRMQWTRRAFASREIPAEHFTAAVSALADTLYERLPPGSKEIVAPFFEAALTALASPESLEAVGLDAALEPDRRALTFVQEVLEGRSRDAIDRVLAEVDAGMPVETAYLETVLPAVREVGTMWHAGESGILEEHTVTMAAQRLMGLLRERATPASPVGRTAVIACVAGNIHDVGVRATTDFFEMAGWSAVNLGPDVPEHEIVRGIRLFDADVVVLAATLAPHVKALQRAIEAIREIELCDVKVIVGGPAFGSAPDLWRRVGADGYATTLGDTPAVASRLVERARDTGGDSSER